MLRELINDADTLRYVKNCIVKVAELAELDYNSYSSMNFRKDILIINYNISDYKFSININTAIHEAWIIKEGRKTSTCFVDDKKFNQYMKSNITVC